MNLSEIEKIYTELMHLRQDAQDSVLAFFDILFKLNNNLEANKLKPGSVPLEEISGQIDDYYIYTAGYLLKKENISKRYDSLVKRLSKIETTDTSEETMKTACNEAVKEIDSCKAKIIEFHKHFKKE